ncbi:hypothetical protein RN001_004800 [Aquatica leii]|uniref:OTU domain-containing protein n=1 Tax=Aquatica leii TaxID=1421715 RepID=A0AAN7PIW9_9COLE|nr:hypothetical protein RN001_004800 [Aquatica leii]
MANKFSKRGKNPGAVDAWLDSLGYYRKNVAYDETCLFRAVSEQLFYSQLYHEKVRKDCIAYGKKFCKEFKSFYPKKRDWWERLKQLNLHMQICNDVEIQLICNTYRIDVSVFNANDHTIKDFRCGSLAKTEGNVLLCKMNEDHYDSVYDKQYINNAGYCQSIVYKILYEDVFEISNVSSIVNSMLHEKQPIYSLCQCESDASVKEEYFCDEEERENDLKLVASPLGQNTLIAPFPFKVAKALDPNMYRNIEYDTWLEVRRAMRLGDWYYGDDKLILGTRCNINVDGVPSPCYIQEILKDNRCVVYVTSLAERWTVNYSDLKPEDNAKPWPMPYRFVRKASIQSAGETISVENEQLNLRKRREKNRNHNNTVDKVSKSEVPESDLNSLDYKGCNLDVVPDSNLVENNLTINITNPNYDNVENWNHLNNWSHGEELSLNWGQSPNTCQTDTNSSTLNKVQTPSQDPVRAEPYYYEQELPYSVPVWVPHSYVLPAEPNATISGEEQTPPISDSARSQNCVYYQVDNLYGSPTLLTPPLSTPSPSITPFSLPINDRFVCSAPVTPMSPHCDSYSFVYPVPHQNPSYFYSYPPHPYSPFTPRPPEVLAPIRSPVPIYSNPNEIQYSPSAYICPAQTPPVAWFPPNVNAQGFIFPRAPPAP